MLHIITGPPCAGKTTYAQHHAQPGDLIIDHDELCATITHTPDGHDASPYVRRLIGIARHAIIQHITHTPDPTHDAWIIHGNPSPKQLHAYQNTGATIHKLDPGIRECATRATHDHRPERTYQGIARWYSARNHPDDPLAHIPTTPQDIRG